MKGHLRVAFLFTITCVFIFLYEIHELYMTTLVENNIGSFYVNDPSLTMNQATTKVWLKSQYSQEIEGPYSAADISQTDRYARVTVTFPNGWDESHYNGFYTYYIGQGDGTYPDIIFHQDIVKIITEPGGGNGEVEYISTNEDREAEVYYRPNY